MTFLAFYLLITINTDIATRFGRLDALTVDNCCTWFGVSPISKPDFAPKCRIDPFKRVIFGPFPKIVVDTMIVWEIFREIPPLAASTCQVEQRIHDFAQINLMWSASSSFLLNKRFDKLPFRINKIAWIAFVVCLLAIFDIFSRSHDKLLHAWQ